MGDENTKPKKSYDDEYAGLGVASINPKVRTSNRPATVLPTLKRHSNICEEGRTRTSSFHQSLGFQPQNKIALDPKVGFTRKASENYCMDFKRKYSSSKENCILQHFAGSLNRNYNM